MAGSLDHLIRERLSRFRVAGVEVLRWAALLSPRIDVGKLVKVSGLDDAEVGEALASSGLPRDRVFVTTKIGRQNLAAGA